MRVGKTALCRGMFTFDRTPGANVSSLRGCRNHIVCRKLKNKPFCYTVSRAGRRVALNGYNYFMRVNAARAHLSLSRFDLPPTVPSFSPNPVAELAIANTGGAITMKLRVPSQPGQCTLVQGAAPVSAGVRCVQHFPLLGLLPAPVDGWSDIKALYVARYGAPIVGTAVFIRTCQHNDEWTDLPKVASAFVPAG